MRLDRPNMPPDGSSGVILPPRGKDGGQRVKPDPLNLHKYRRRIVLLDGVASLNVKNMVAPNPGWCWGMKDPDRSWKRNLS